MHIHQENRPFEFSQVYFQISVIRIVPNVGKLNICFLKTT